MGPRGARANHRRIIPRHVGNADRDDARGMRMLRKPPAFDAGEMLAHRVDFDDRSAAGEQRPRHCLLVRKREPGGGRDPICRGAAGNQHQHQILGAGGIGEVERFAARGETGCVGQGGARLDAAHPARRAALCPPGPGGTPDAGFRARTVAARVSVRDGLWTRVKALKARWKAPLAIAILMARSSPARDPHVQAKGRAMALDDKTRPELEAATFRRLVEHLRKHTDVQNIDLMNLAGFCRNCLSNWMKDAADARGVPMSKDESRETIYGMPYDEWKAKHQKEASKDQQAAFQKAGHKH